MPFDEEELDPHGECRAEIDRLKALSQNNAHSWDALVKDRDQLLAAIHWALGEGPDGDGKHFGHCVSDNISLPPYWWRTNLRKLAGFRVHAYDKEKRTLVQTECPWCKTVHAGMCGRLISGGQFD